LLTIDGCIDKNVYNAVVPENITPEYSSRYVPHFNKKSEKWHNALNCGGTIQAEYYKFLGNSKVSKEVAKKNITVCTELKLAISYTAA
jgi:hypothetical protein